MKENIIIDEQGTLRTYAGPTKSDAPVLLSRKLRLMKLVWVFFLFSIFGFLLETGWSYIYHGFFESRKSLVFGPFSIIYGIGAVLIIFIGDFMRNRNNWTIYITGTVCGTLFEYFCSVFQEVVFGTVSWDYSGDPFTLGGRASLVFGLVWGLLAVIAVRFVSPLVDRLVIWMSGKWGTYLTVVIICILSVDMFLSASAVLRQNERKDGIAANNAFELFLDNHYPDEKLNMIYVNMRPAGGRLIRDENGRVVK